LGQQSDDEHVIPPGQEALLAEMLGRGAALPGQCEFAGGQVDRQVVVGTYKCPGGEVVIELRHPNTAPPDQPRSEQFAVVVRSGAAPAELTTSLVERVRDREGDFEWASTGAQSAPAAPSSRSYPVVAAVLAVALLVWLRRRRRSAAQRARSAGT
jgi:MYXO-CTERM domain-containing protein